ncbi:MAG: GntR family transcriptional regulator [Candidatus Rokubacteria bacterium]|nr:GntR family transcriptional regulator [Candidatus Rokubacteria bacterium]
MPPRESMRIVPPSGLRVNRQSSVPVHVQLKTQIRHLIMTGSLKPGSQVPTVRQLAGFLGINPNTAAKALAELQQDGYLESRPGRGTFVAERLPAGEGKMARGLERLVDETLERARRLGYSGEEFLATAATRAPVAGARKARRTPALLIECNWPEVSRFRDELEAELPLAVDRMLVEELTERARHDPSFVREYGVVITTFFHVNEVKAALEAESVPVAALLTEANISTLLRLSELSEGTTVGLVCGTPKGTQNLLRSVQSAGLTHLKPVLASADDPWSVKRMLEATSIVVCSEQAAEKLREILPPTVEVIFSNRTLDRGGIDLLRDVLTRLDESPRAATR